MKQEDTKFDFEAFSKEAADHLRAGKPMVGQDGVFTPLLKAIIEAAMEGELDSHLSDTRKTAGNRRNGKTDKQLQSPLGGFHIQAPRDRNASFEPQIVQKRQHKITSDIDAQILGLYALGMSYEDIRRHLAEMYGLQVSDGTLSGITDRIIPEIKDWQNRPLESLYPVIWLDAMHFKVRQDGVVQSKAVYNILGVNIEGSKEVLGIYFGDSESSRFWRQVLHDLKQRGVSDILVACIDNLNGFADSIEDLFPSTDVQLCLVHQMRNSIKYISDKDMKPMVGDLKKIYKAENVDMAAHHLRQAELRWGAKYRVVFKSWNANWDRLTNFFDYPPALRRLIYTTNPIESYHRMIRKVTKTKGAFNSETAILKQIYLATINAQTKWSGSIFGWSAIRRDLYAYFEDRLLKDDTVN